MAGYAVIFLTVYYMLLQSYDLSGFEKLNGLASSQAFAYFVIVLNEFGSELVLIPFAGLMYLISRNRKLETASLLVYSVVLSDLVLLVLKAAYYRPRPAQTLSNVILPLGPETDSSFPSGHSTRAFAVATLTTMARGRKYSPLLILASGVALARVVLGVHFPLDVTGGAFLGLLIGIVSYETGRRLYRFAMPKLFPDRTFG